MDAAADTVSLCLAVWNEERHIGETLESIRRQTHRAIEVHIFDNASTDGTAAICRDFLADARFRYHRNAANIGAVRNFNRVHSVASGDFVVPFSGNDVLEPTYVERLLEPMRRDPRTGLVAAQLAPIDESSMPLPEGRWMPGPMFVTDCSDPVAAATTVIREWQYPNYYFGLYRRSVMERLQPQRFLFGADAAFVCELSLYAHIRAVDAPLLRLRRHERPQVAHVARAFSEGALYGVAENSLFARFERLTPHIDFTWALIEMFSLAGVTDAQRHDLSRAAISIQRKRYGALIAEEAKALAAAARATEPLWGRPALRLPRMLLGRRLLERVSRALVVLPRNPDLREICPQLAAALAAADGAPADAA
ncbi:MAG: glycosyltransferase family 2 protein [Alphaproteobacteria bacterium]